MVYMVYCCANHSPAMNIPQEKVQQLGSKGGTQTHNVSKAVVCQWVTCTIIIMCH